MRARCFVFCLGLTVLGSLARAQSVAPPPPRADRVAVLIARGDARHAVGDEVSALGYYRDAIAAGPRRREGYLALGGLYLGLGEPTRALEVYEAALRAQAHDEALVLAYARTLRALGDSEKARTALRRWVQQQPDSSAALEALAELAEARGAFVEALSARRGALALAPPGSEPAALNEARTRVRALERIVGAAERVRAPRACDDPAESLVGRALARCP